MLYVLWFGVCILRTDISTHSQLSQVIEDWNLSLLAEYTTHTTHTLVLILYLTQLKQLKQLGRSKHQNSKLQLQTSNSNSITNINPSQWGSNGSRVLAADTLAAAS
ncbi:hypothetical protein BDV97DRAFT_373807 [Delphinella strobiligena]|nr:hypothetical protein BDV97DRAFT_373807 [Delphinella strobiligena]